MELNPQKYCFLWNKINIGYIYHCVTFLLYDCKDTFSALSSVTLSAEHLAVFRYIYARVPSLVIFSLLC